MCPHTTIFELDARLSDMATKGPIYVSSYYYMCPHTTIVSSYYIMCPHAMCPVYTYIHIIYI
jgi:hypothetical protein